MKPILFEYSDNDNSNILNSNVKNIFYHSVTFSNKAKKIY